MWCDGRRHVEKICRIRKTGEPRGEKVGNRGRGVGGGAVGRGVGRGQGGQDKFGEGKEEQGNAAIDSEEVKVMTRKKSRYVTVVKITT